MTDIIDNSQIKNEEKWLVFEQNETLSVVPQITKIRFGQQCCKNIDLFDFFELYQIGSNKILIDCETIDWQRMINLTEFHMINQKFNVYYMI